MLDRGTVVGGYRIEGLLGGGGMGTVFRARDIESDRVVALKLMAEGVSADPNRDARFRGEGRAQALLEHPHVVTVYDAGESEHGLYLAMGLDLNYVGKESARVEQRGYVFNNRGFERIR